MLNMKKMQPQQTPDDIRIDFGDTIVETQDDSLDFDFENTEQLIGAEVKDENVSSHQDLKGTQNNNVITNGISDTQNETDNKKKLRKNKQQTVAPKVKQDIVLQFVIDKSTSDMLEYFRGYGVNVSRIFNDIEEAKNEILMQINPCRIVIVDTGTGRFSLIGARKALIDLLGIGDEDNKISVFYTDSAIKEDISMAEEVDNRQIDWIKYRSTADILAILLQKRQDENYIIDSTAEEARTHTNTEELMRFKGLTMQSESIDLGLPSISAEEVGVHREEEGHQLRAYEVKY